MRTWVRWLYAAAAVAVCLVAAAAIVQAVHERSWTPVLEVGWIPAVIVAAWPGGYRRCLPRRHSQAG